jgi:hypothetical protein
MAEQDAPLDIDLLTASLRADASDLGAFVEALAVKLEDAAPDRVQVDRRKKGMFGPKLVRRIALDAGDRRLELLCENGTIDTRASRLSGGIVLKNDALAVDAWLTAVGEALAAEAQRSQSTRSALERMLLGSTDTKALDG